MRRGDGTPGVGRRSGLLGARRRLRFAAALAVAAPWAAQAQGAATVRVADHPGFGRIVFEFPAPVTFNLAVDGDRVLVVFDGAPAIGAAGAPPRNVRSIQGGQGAATLVLSPGARARSSALGNRVVVDVLDPPRTARAVAGRGGARAPGAVPGLEGGSAGPGSQDVAAGSQPPGATNAPAADATGQDATGQDATGHDATGKGSAGKDAPGKSAAVREPAGSGAAGKDAAGKDGSGKVAAVREPAGSDAAGKDTTGRDATGKGGAGKDAVGKDAESPGEPGPEKAPPVPVAVARVAAVPVAAAAEGAATPLAPDGGRTVYASDLAPPPGTTRAGPVPSAASQAGPPPAARVPVQPAPVVPLSVQLPAAMPPAGVPPAAVAEAPSLLVLAGAGVGAAALRRGDVALVIFDGEVEVDEARLRRLPGFAGVSVQPGPNAMVLLLPSTPGGIGLVREAQGWRVSAGASAGVAVETVQAGLGMLLKLAQPGRVVAITDPATGGALLVGTAGLASGPAGGLAAGVNAPGAAVLPTWAGVAVEPFSDDVVLRATAGGFVVEPAGVVLAAAPGPALTRRFDFPGLPVPALLQRLRAASAGAAAAAPRARTPGRIATAQAMLALGLAAEAGSVLSLAAADDPAAAGSADMAGLTAIAALLAGRLDAAGGLDVPGLDGSDEVALWRGIRDAMLGRTEAAARALPPLMSLALAYPEPLRDRILPIVAETAVLAGHPSAAALPDLPRLGFARALQLERAGQTDAALAALDALAAGRDQLDQVRAGARAIEVRLAAGRLTPADAAAAMNRLAATWRGDTQEAATRMRAAELFGTAGAWRTALDLLRETEALFPDLKPAIRARMAGVFSAFLAKADAAPAVDVIVLAADYADLVPPGADLARVLTDKLLDLDLPARARPMLAARVAAASPGPVRSGLGYRLALLHLEAGDAAAASQVLAASEAAGLPDRLASERGLLRAKVQAALGDPVGAAASLGGAGTLAADELRARLLEQAGDWRGAVQALEAAAARTIPASGPIPEGTADLVMRQATAAVQLADAGLLQSLNKRYAERLSGPQRDVFRLLTAAPVGGVGDLPRAAAELTLARTAAELTLVRAVPAAR